MEARSQDVAAAGAPDIAAPTGSPGTSTGRSQRDLGAPVSARLGAAWRPSSGRSPRLAHGSRDAEPAPVLIPGADGADLALHDFGGDGPPLLMAHATGMHGWVFRSLAENLASRFHCWAVDLRGHGQSLAIEGETFDWGGFARDVGCAAEYVAQSANDRLVGFGHSLGGAAMTLAASRRPDVFAELVLYEAAVLPPGRSTQDAFGRQIHQMVSAAKRRRDSFTSAAEAAYNYAGKLPTRALEAGVLRDYVRHGFTVEQGRVELRCRPVVEATTFAQTPTQERYGLWSALGDLSCPVSWLVGSETDAEQLSTAHAVGQDLGIPVTELAGLDHFGPLQLPALVAQQIRSTLRS